MAAQPATPPVRHAIARTTGATILARKLGDGWTIEYLSHGATTTAPNRSPAWIVGSHPQGYCSTCAAIVAGKVERVTGERVALPATKAAPVASKRPPTKSRTGRRFQTTRHCGDI